MNRPLTYALIILISLFGIMVAIDSDEYTEVSTATSNPSTYDENLTGTFDVLSYRRKGTNKVILQLLPPGGEIMRDIVNVEVTFQEGRPQVEISRDPDGRLVMKYVPKRIPVLSAEHTPP